MPDLSDICCARLPTDALASLASLRTHTALRMLRQGETLWLTWPAGDEAIVEHLFALPGVELFTQRGEEGYYRLDRHLPTFDVPDFREAEPLAMHLAPALLEPTTKQTMEVRKVSLRLVGDVEIRPTSAWMGARAVFASWAELAPTEALASLQAAIHEETMLVVGASLPWLPGMRFWGTSVLVPLGYRIEPSLPHEVMCEVLGLEANDLALFTDEGVEVVAREVLAPISRASIRLANREETP